MIRYRLAIEKEPTGGKVHVFVDLYREKGDKDDKIYNFKYFSDEEKTLAYLETILSYSIEIYPGDFCLEGGIGTANDPIADGLVEIVKKYKIKRNLKIHREIDDGEVILRRLREQG